MVKQRKQSNFFESLKERTTGRTTHSGSLAKGKRKERRPLETKKALHLVMRASKATGKLNMLRTEHRTHVEKTVRRQATKFGIRIASFANVGNHLHILLRFSHRRSFQQFLKSSTAMIARIVTKARKGNPFGKFWDALAYSRIVRTAKEIAIVRKYVAANVIEASLGKVARDTFLKEKSSWEEKLYSG